MADGLEEALLQVQRKVPSFQRNALNPHFKSRYTSLDTLLDSVLPLLQEEELLWRTYPCVTSEGKAGLRYKMTHVPSGESDEDVMALMIDKGTPQAQGSGISYGRRYALVAYLNLVIDQDDDGNAATSAAKEATLPAQETSKPAVTASTPEEQAVLRQSIADLTLELQKSPEEWAKVEAWSKERSIDLTNPAANKVRAVESALRKKLDTLAAKRAAEPEAKS